MSSRKVKERDITLNQHKGKMCMSGWFSGKRSYLRFEASSGTVGCLQGASLYRLAKALGREFEKEKGASR